MAETAPAQPRQRPDRIGGFWAYPDICTFADLLIDCEEDRTLRAVLVGDPADPADFRLAAG